jgi:hypothetical protein
VCSGLYYYGARYLAPWLARWIQVNVNILMKVASNLQLHTAIMDTVWLEKNVWKLDSRTGNPFSETLFAASKKEFTNVETCV